MIVGRGLSLTPGLTRTLRRGGQVGELGVALEEAELDRVGGAVAVLGEDDLGEPLRVGLLAVVVLVAVDEGDEVGVLLDRAGLSRRSERIGRLSWRCSTARESWERARIGTSRSRASTFSWREICETSCTRFSGFEPEVISCR